VCTCVCVVLVVFCSVTTLPDEWLFVEACVWCVCVCVCVCMYVCICVCVVCGVWLGEPSYYMCSPPIHTYIHVHTYINTYTYIHNTHIYIHTNVHGYGATSRRQGTSCLSKGLRITCTYIHIYTYIQTYMDMVQWGGYE